jgi:NNP family nitrate/nitrite transporter-like MFS transporter
MVGGFGNLGGIIFAIIFRYSHHDYARGIWILGVISMAVFISVSWVRPVPKSQMRE